MDKDIGIRFPKIIETPYNSLYGGINEAEIVGAHRYARAEQKSKPKKEEEKPRKT